MLGRAPLRDQLKGLADFCPVKRKRALILSLSLWASSYAIFASFSSEAKGILFSERQFAQRRFSSFSSSITLFVAIYYRPSGSHH